MDDDKLVYVITSDGKVQWSTEPITTVFAPVQSINAKDVTAGMDLVAYIDSTSGIVSYCPSNVDGTGSCPGGWLNTGKEASSLDSTWL